MKMDYCEGHFIACGEICWVMLLPLSYDTWAMICVARNDTSHPACYTNLHKALEARRLPTVQDINEAETGMTY